MRFLLRCCCCAAALLFAVHATAQNASAIATAFIRNIADGKASVAYERTDSALHQKVTPTQLSGIWQQLEQQFGKWQNVTAGAGETVDGRTAVLTNNEFERALVTLRVMVNSRLQVAGFTVTQVSARADPGTALPANTREENVTVATPDGDLQGTLTLPEGMSKMPVALIIAGSGPTDRNGNNSLGVTAQPYRLLAYQLAAKGIATLRYDKRYTGTSNHFRNPPAQVVLEDFVNDAVACLKRLKGDARFAGVYIIGHSEGSLIAMLAANAVPVDGLVSLSGAGRGMDQLLSAQVKTLMPDHYTETVRLFEAMKKGEPLPAMPEALKAIFNAQNLAFIRSSIAYDPAAVLAKVKPRVLVVAGSQDLQVRETEAALLMAAKPSAKYVLIPGMNHVLKQAPKDVEGNLKTYTDPSLPVDDQLVAALVTFIRL